MNGTQFLITKGLTIQGPGANLLTIDAQQQSRIFSIGQFPPPPSS